MRVRGRGGRVDVRAGGDAGDRRVRVGAGRPRRVDRRVRSVLRNRHAVRQRGGLDDAHRAHAPLDARRHAFVERPPLALVCDVRDRREVDVETAGHAEVEHLVAGRAVDGRPADETVRGRAALGNVAPACVEAKRCAPLRGARAGERTDAHPKGIRVAGHPRHLNLDGGDRSGRLRGLNECRLVEAPARRELQLVLARAACGSPGEGGHLGIGVVGADALVGDVLECVQALRHRHRHGRAGR